MIIGIASGKGGTGKTTVATSLARVLSHGDPGRAVWLLDCDVEQPNAHLFIRPVFESSETVTLPVPEVDRDRCDACGACDRLCQFKAIALVGDAVMCFPEMCHGCGGCQLICPRNAITEGSRELGCLDRGRLDGLEFASGTLRVGEAMAPPLIRAVRAQAKSDAITIVDAPPGTSCPMIAAVRGADFVVLVSEPTPFGLNDLALALETIRLLGIPCGLVINRSDIGDGRLRAFAQREALPILLEIPFDRRIAEAYATGVMLVDRLPRWRAAFAELFEKIQAVVEWRRGA